MLHNATRTLGSLRRQPGFSSLHASSTARARRSTLRAQATSCALTCSPTRPCCPPSSKTLMRRSRSFPRSLDCLRFDLTRTYIVRPRAALAPNTYGTRKPLSCPGGAFNAARKTGRYAGANPIMAVPKRRVPKRFAGLSQSGRGSCSASGALISLASIFRDRHIRRASEG